MHSFKQFIEANRQTGTTTILMEQLKIKSRAYLVVSSHSTKQIILKKYPELKPQIFTTQEINNGAWRGRTPGPIFFDTDVVWSMIDNFEKSLTPVKVVDSQTTLFLDGYQKMHIDGCSRVSSDGYNQTYDQQLNVKLTKEDTKDIEQINADFFENEATKSMLGRILLRKGIQFYKKLMG